MYIHLGNGISVERKNVIGIFDIDYCSVDKRSRKFLTDAQKSGIVVNVSPYEIPKSFVVTTGADGNRVFITNLSPATLAKRASSDLIAAE